MEIFRNLAELFIYDPKSPLLFNSGAFFLFFSVFIIIYSIFVKKKWFIAVYVIVSKNKFFDERVDGMVYMVTAALGFAAQMLC